jgi:hypothetical protein
MSDELKASSSFQFITHHSAFIIKSVAPRRLGDRRGAPRPDAQCADCPPEAILACLKKTP